MIIHKCDRCGAEMNSPHTIMRPDKHNITQESVELCDSCYDDFQNWMVEKKGIGVEPEVFEGLDEEKMVEDVRGLLERCREIADKMEIEGGEE